MLGIITGNDPVQFVSFSASLGRKPDLALLAFDQRGPAELDSSIPYIIAQGLTIGVAILWSVPCPGAGQLEAIGSGAHDGMYQRCATAILAASPADGSPIRVRLPWEMNLRANRENAAVDKHGNWNGAAFIAAWLRIEGIFRAVLGKRACIIWCPNATTGDFDPIHCLPPYQHYDVIAQDYYLQKAWNKPGDFGWFLNEPRGLAWGAALAHDKGKRYGLSEWGMDDDRFAGDFAKAATWLKGLGTLVDHQCWWNRSEVIDCLLDSGRPKLVAAYEAAFG